MNELLRYEGCGLDNVWLRNGFTEPDTAYGKGVAIHDLEGLHKAIGLHLVCNQPSLSGKEVRFLRKELDMSQVDLARVLGVGDSSVRGWENGRTDISSSADRLLRVLYYEYACGNAKIKELVDRVGQLNRDAYAASLEFEETGSGWSTAA